MKEEKTDILNFWQERFSQAKTEYDDTIINIKDNQEAYNGTRKIKSLDGKRDAKKQGYVSRKMCFELVETQADVNIPAPRVISLRGREDRARMIEAVIRNEIDRVNLEEIVDEQARITPTTGGSVFFLEWDNSKRTNFGVGTLKIKNLDPKQVIPQPGVYKLDEMDYVFLVFEQTKQYVKSVYGVDVEIEGDQNEVNPKDHMVTHVYCYYRNDDMSIGLFSYAGDTIVQDYSNYFARLQDKCTKCGKIKISGEDICECGNKKFSKSPTEFEKMSIDVMRPDITTGEMVPTTEEIDVKYYVPDCWPVVVRKNVGEINKFLGNSDIDFIKDQQNDLNIYMTKIKEKLLKGGSIVTVPKGTTFDATDEEFKIVELSKPSDKAIFDVISLQPNTNNDVAMLNLNYEIGRQTLGITDTFQGRSDYTATSGKAKEIAIAQTAGRLESKKAMKDFAFSQLYQTMFQFILAFTDEQRPYIIEGADGKNEYHWFDKRFFIEKDELTGKFYYDDDFVFSTDVSGTLANNREAMWRETRSNFESGSYGDPAQLDTLVMYWTTMNKLHYPCAPDALKLLEKRQQEQQRMLQKQAQDQATADAFAKNKTEELLKENEELKSTQEKTTKEKADNALNKLGIKKGGE